MTRILVIETTVRISTLLRDRLAPIAKVKSAPCLDAALAHLIDCKFDLIVWNVTADPPVPGNLRGALESLASHTVDTKTIVLTGSNGLGCTLPQDGRLHLHDQPMSDDELVSLIEGLMPVDDIAEPALSNKDDLVVPIEFEGMIAESLAMRSVIRRIIDAAAVDIPVLITGETGTGKDLAAAAIHRQSDRKDKPYVAINMGAMTPELITSEVFGHERGAFTGAHDARSGIFEQADGGTVFLDEIATMDEKAQISLLRVLETKNFRRVGGVKNICVDVRIIAATNINLEKAVTEKRFREDLFYRLNVFQINLPPLRERVGAVTVLTDHFVSQFSAAYGKHIKRVCPDTDRILRRHSWPGNVRELKNVIQAAILMLDGTELTPELLPRRIRDAAIPTGQHDDSTCPFHVGVTLNAVEKELIRRTLARVGGNKKLAASILGISRRALYNKIKRN